MKILVISTPIFKLPCTGYSGLEHLAYQQAAGLAKKGHQVSIVAPDGSECPGVTVIPIGPERQVDERTAYQKYWQELLKFDVILDHTWLKWALSLKMEGQLKAPVLCWCHAPVSTMFQSLPNVEKPCFVCISEDQKSHFEALFGREARVCHNGVDPDFYRPLGIPRTKRFLFLARFSTIKGPDLAIEACRKAGVGLDLVGDTSITQEPDFLKKCTEMCDGTSLRTGRSRLACPEDHDHSKDIILQGPATRGETVHWYSQAHCLLHPNQRFREPLGLAPLESMLCETPVIAWRFGAMKKTVKEGISGFLVNSLDEIINLIKTDAVNTIDRKKCREWAAEHFSLERMINRVESLALEAEATGGW